MKIINVSIRRISTTDAPFLRQLLTDPQIRLTYMVPDLDPAQLEALIDRLSTLSAMENHFVRVIEADGEPVGILNDTDLSDRQIELGWAVLPAFQGRGIATEAVRQAVEQLFATGFRRVIAGAFTENHASIRVMEKCGMMRLDREDTVVYRGCEHRCVFYGVNAL